MSEICRTLAPAPVADLQEYVQSGGGRALDMAHRISRKPVNRQI
mgnify:CR=1 FL=1